MSDQSDNLETSAGTSAKTAVSEYWPELAVSGIIMALAILVLVDSLRVGIGWADDGPKSGYFPFYIGLILLSSSGVVFVAQLLKGRKDAGSFAEPEQLATVFAMLAPMSIYIVSMIWLGIYLPSIVLVAYFMRRYGKFAWWITAIVSIGVSVAFYLLFEKWFLVPLPKGPIENWLGF
jgi:hypothetical protein